MNASPALPPAPAMATPATALSAADASLVSHWLAQVQRTAPSVRQRLQAVVAHHAPALADGFYQTMLKDDSTRVLLDHEVVDTRLHAAMQRWLQQLFGATTEAAIVEAVALQRHVGLVHARVNVGIDLVQRGARALKQMLVDAILRTPASDEADTPLHPDLAAVAYAGALVDLALEVMAHQHYVAHDRATRTDEAYRSFASSVNMSLERERQRTALLDWQSQFLQEVMMARSGDVLARLSQSSFGLWVQHKASAFTGLRSEREAILASMRQVDASLLPLCQRELNGRSDELRRLIRQVLAEVQQLRYFTDAMFEHLVDMESGRDVLTQLLNRRYLPAVLGREIEFSRQSGQPFSLMLIDVDHFKRVNDQHGHSSGDRVLQHLAGVLANSVRSGDFVFRFGGEEFMVISVEASLPQALREADRIRQAVAADEVRLANGAQLGMTVSIGVACYNGHPDYQHLLDQADQALYAAKQGGRNRVEAAQP